ncbi:diguanylate cyclase [Massilia aurea]|uniref:sensor domain-containing diguanylate cyclase n=1 Tax=Massilia aurea TaxID=373040 RepID=UPI0034626938
MQPQEPNIGLLSRVLNLIDCGVIVLDAQACIVHWSGWLVPRSGRGAARVTGHPLIEVFPALRGSRVEAAVQAALTDGMATGHVPDAGNRTPFPLRPAGSFDGDLIDQAVAVTPFDDAGERFCLIEIRDVSDSADRERRLLEHAEAMRARSFIDGLTGIANRRHFDVALTRELRRAQRAGSNLALLLFDIDTFKAYNDHFGHQEGDACLVKVAQEIAGILKRPGDMAARYGGEEFAAILPDTSAEQARAMAERIRAHIEGLKLPQAPAAHHGHVTLSVGVAAFDRARLNDEAALIEAADQALYAAKDGGRNRVVADGDAAPAAARV